MKLLVAGDVDGNFRQLFSRAESILKKSGPFEMLLCVGSFFGDSECSREQWQSYVEGKEKVPLPTYILGPGSPGEAVSYQSLGRDGGELCPNLTCLGQRGVFKTSGGLQVVYLSGRHHEDRFSQDLSSQKTMSPYMTSSDVESLKEMAAKSKEEFRGVDILLTTEWPRGVATHTATPPDWLDADNAGSVEVAQLAVAVRPRYHIVAGLKHFYERTPYRNHQVLRGQQLHVTRFIALANVGNPDKKNRYLYAFNITPLTEMDTQELVQQPPAITNCPYHHLLGTKVYNCAT
ncbi:CWF19-like protein 1 [Geodia barretti]|uniref:CWF19-like protein 1 n=1 Tax=Geodia barretti TaxID=519541 RepID=A0AA35T0C2_GEOBA|nr:CWF19-like protein 1 [Geodia barretti]